MSPRILGTFLASHARATSPRAVRAVSLGVILPQLVNPFGVYFMMTYIAGVMPDELIDAARLDGANDYRIFLSVALPIFRPGYVTLLLIAFVGAWNNFFLPLLLLSQTNLFPVTLGLSSWLSQVNAQMSAIGVNMVLTGSVLSIVPMLILFPFMQRYVMTGLAQAAMKMWR